MTILRQSSKKLKNPSLIIKLALMIKYAIRRLMDLSVRKIASTLQYRKEQWKELWQ